MCSSYLDLNEARKKRTTKDMSDEEKREILDYLKAHSEDKEAIPYLMEKHHCSNTTICILIMKDEDDKRESGI